MKKNISLLLVFFMAILLGMGAVYYFAYASKNVGSTSEATPVAVEQTPVGGTMGKVVETMEAGGYTYVQVDSGGQKVWAAAPQFPVKVGEEVIIPDGLQMNNFHSTSLNRDFETIYLVNSIMKKGDLPLQMDTEGHGSMGGTGSGMSAAKLPVAIDFSGIKKAEGGKTIAEIFAAKTDLVDKEVVLRGKVIKYTPQIMGKNWIHVQDGSGGPGTNDLTVTTSATIAVGDTVLVKGVVHANKDFGSGYRYDLIIEDATITVE